MTIAAIAYFNQCFDEELKFTTVSIPAACCLSTIGTDHYPNARFVSLKAVVENNFIVTGSITSRKGIEINITNKVALAFWWPETARQVRIQGNATIISNSQADKYFAERSRESQLVSIASRQGQILNSIEELNKNYQDVEMAFINRQLTRPETWSGYSIEPIRIEFLEFKTSRFHNRKLYELTNGQWISTELQP